MSRSTSATFRSAPEATLQLKDGAIELARLVTGVKAASGGLRADARSNYVIELAVQFTTAAKNDLRVTLRRPGEGPAYFLRLMGQRRAVDVVHYDRATTSLTAPVSIRPDRTVWIAVVVNGSTFTLFVDQRQVAQATDTRIAPQPYVPNLELWEAAELGAWRVAAIRLYELP